MRAFYRNGDTVELPHTGCDGCMPLTINGMFCHETGCLEEWRDREVQCRECGCGFFADRPRVRVCEDCR